MKRTTAFTLIAALAVFSVACSKHTSGPSAGYGPNSLFPTTAGDTWYFIDSAWADTAGNLTLYTYSDTMVATKNAIQDQQTGTIYLEMNNPYGWFNASYIAVDPSNYFVYEADSLTQYQTYTMFELVNSTGLIGQSSTGGSCPIISQQYGYANPVTINNFSCYQNTEVTTDCHGTVLEQTDYYLSPGVGPVRIDDWMTDTTAGVNKFYEDYSQTLTAKNLH
jgi:hypothetical protein